MSGTRPRDIEALILLIEDRAALSFGWRGKRDCAGFAAAAIEAQTGVDVLAGLSWSTRGGALAVLDAEGGKIGRAACRERGCQYVEISVVAGALKKKNNYVRKHSSTM